jgi:hypothetical protein
VLRYADMTEVFDITAWCREVGISENGAKKLQTAEVRDDLAVTLLEAEDIASVKLAPGDLVKFRHGQRLLRKKLDTIPALEDIPEFPTLGSLKPNKDGCYTLEQVTSFLAEKASQPLPVSKPAPSQSGALLPPSRRDRTRCAEQSGTPYEEDHPENIEYGRHLLKDLLTVDDCYTNAAGERPLLPVNFIRNPKGTITDLDEQVVTEDGKLVVKPNVLKPTADQLKERSLLAV